MTENQTSNIDAIQAKKVDGIWYAQKPDAPFWGKGETLEAACQDLESRAKEYQDFSDTSGLPPIDLRSASVRSSGPLREAWRILRILLIVSLCSIPVSYAISTGLKRTAEDTGVHGGRKFWTRVENSIVELGNRDIFPPDKVEVLSQSMESIVRQLRPFTSQLSLLFTPMDEGSAKPDDKTTNEQSK